MKNKWFTLIFNTYICQYEKNQGSMKARSTQSNIGSCKNDVFSNVRIRSVSEAVAIILIPFNPTITPVTFFYSLTTNFTESRWKSNIEEA